MDEEDGGGVSEGGSDRTWHSERVRVTRMRGESLGIGGTGEGENGERGHRGWKEYAGVVSPAIDELPRRGGKSCERSVEGRSDSAISRRPSNQYAINYLGRLSVLSGGRIWGLTYGRLLDVR